MPSELREKRIVLALVLVVSLTGFISTSFLALNLLLVREPPGVREAIASGFREGALDRRAYLEFDTRIGRHQHNDCLILSYFILDEGRPLRRALSPKRPIVNNPCQWLYAVTVGDSHVGRSEYYHRYWHGPRTVIAPLLRFLTIDQIRRVLWWTSTGTLALGVLLFLKRARTAHGSGARSAYLAGALVCLSLLLFYGLPYYGMSLSHGPSDIALIAFILAGLSVNLLRLPFLAFIVFFTLFGCIIAYFEFFTGGAPLGLASVLGLITISSLRHHAAPRLLLSRLLYGCGTFVVAFVACFVYKILVTAVIFDDPVTGDFLSELGYRMGGTYWDVVDVAKYREYGFDPTGHATYSLYSLLVLAGKLAYSTAYLAMGDWLVGSAVVLVAVSVVVSAVAAGLRQRDAMVRLRWAAIGLSVAVIPVWYLVFLNHSIIHAKFMVRILVWIVAMACVAGVMHLARSSQRGQPRWLKAVAKIYRRA